jgi:FkbH-like protein
MYATERARKAATPPAGALDEWFASLGVTVTVEALNQASLERAAQLFNKTNQMNLATRRLSAAELMQWASEPTHSVLTFRVADRFGDMGVTGIVGLERDGVDARLSDFLLSCRVMGRNVEKTLLHVAVSHARAQGATRLIADFRPTARNRPCLDFFCGCGFQAINQYRFAWKLDEDFQRPAHVALHDVPVSSS